MNGNDQFDHFSSHPSECLGLEEAKHETVKSSTHTSRKYLVVVRSEISLAFTDEKKQASSLKEIHRFVMENLNSLSTNQLDYLLSDQLNQHITVNKGGFRSFFQKIKGLKKIFSVLGKTEQELADEICKTAASKRFRDKFNKDLEENDLKKILGFILFYNKELNIQNSWTEGVKKTITDAELKSNIVTIEESLQYWRQVIQSKQFRRQINKILKQVKPDPQDSLMIQEVKNQILNENSTYIGIMKDIHIHFNHMAEIRLLDDDMEPLAVLPIPTVFSNRAMNLKETVDGYFLRSPSDLSVHNLVSKSLFSNHDSPKKLV